jgi:hypothetical protein
MKKKTEADSFHQAQVNGFRLHRHHLFSRAPLRSLTDVVRDICGVQAQLMPAAQLALRARVTEITQQYIEDALWKERSLVKAWCMRGASHLLVADDLPICLEGLQRHGLRRERDWIAKRGLTMPEIDAVIGAIVQALGNGPLTRKELARQVAAVVGDKAKPWIEHSWGGIVKLACLQGLVCFGPNKGQEITYVKREDWLPKVKDIPIEDAEVSLLRRYLHGYGPACLADFAAWSGTTVQVITPILKKLGSEIVDVYVEGKPSLALREDLEEIQSYATDGNGEQRVLLLPSFDCFMLGHKSKDHLVDPAHYKRVYRKAGWLSPVVLAGGRAVGVWSHKRRGKRVHLTIEMFMKITTNIRRGIEEETRDLARFYDTPCDVTYA